MKERCDALLLRTKDGEMMMIKSIGNAAALSIMMGEIIWTAFQIINSCPTSQDPESPRRSHFLICRPNHELKSYIYTRMAVIPLLDLHILQAIINHN